MLIPPIICYNPNRTSSLVIPSCSASSSYQEAFLTPGSSPASACIRNWYCRKLATCTYTSSNPRLYEFSLMPCPFLFLSITWDTGGWTSRSGTHSSHPKISKDTLSLAASNTSVLDLRRSGITMHLRELELSLCAGSLGEFGVAD